MPGVLPPLSITSGIGYLDWGFVEANTGFGLMKGIKPKSEYTFLGVFYGRAHLNVSVIKAITSRLPGASSQEFERLTPGRGGNAQGREVPPDPGSRLSRR